MANKFYTILFVPEKTQQVRKLVVPSFVLKGIAIGLAFIAVLSVIMVLDYANVMNQISENKQLKVENRQLKQNVQVFKNKLLTVENTLDRVKTFSAKLRIITHTEDQGKSLPGELAPAAPSETKDPNGQPTSQNLAPQKQPETPTIQVAKEIPLSKIQKRKVLLASLVTPSIEYNTMADFSEGVTSDEFLKLDEALGEVSSYAEEQEQETQALLEVLMEKKTLLATTPTLLPAWGRITSEYGVRINPYDGHRKMHEGIDIATGYGSDIKAPADGLVSFAGVRTGYGKLIVLDHGNRIETYYAHTSKLYVKDGERVKRGQLIAAVGNTGHSTGPHLHYEVRAGELPVDPCWYILDVPQICN